MGTRLQPLTNEHAKPSLPILGIPALWYSAWHIAHELKTTDFAINVGHAPETLYRAARDQDLVRFTGISFHFSDETKKILGSSGALWKLKNWIGDSLLAVSNADSISFPSWQKMLQVHRKLKSSLTLHVRAFANTKEAYTTIKVDSKGRVTGFGEKAHSGLMFAGSYLLESGLLARLPDGVSELRPVLLEPLLSEQKLFAYHEDCDWFDTGTVATYAETQFQLLKNLDRIRPLLEVKMREEAREVWVPKTWKRATMTYKGPVVLTGKQEEWQTCSNVFGPRFIGIEPPSGVGFSTQNAVVLSAHIEKL